MLCSVGSMVQPFWRALQVLEHEAMYLEALPCAGMYEKSYMHRDTVTHVAVAPETDFFVTGSVDGHLKFWKKRAEGVEFAKHFRAHLGGVDGAPLHAWLGALHVAAPGADEKATKHTPIHLLVGGCQLYARPT